jgi:hypothetical protein
MRTERMEAHLSMLAMRSNSEFLRVSLRASSQFSTKFSGRSKDCRQKRR